jgi:hypothetical protein
MSDKFDLNWIIGRSIVAVRLNEPSQWLFELEPKINIGAECPWRILKNGQIQISSEDHLQKYGLPTPLDAGTFATELLGSHTITNIEIRNSTADLLIKFTDELQLEIIPFSSWYESWGISTPSGFRIVAQGGGQLSGW